MDRRHDSDNQWYISPLLNLAEWLEETYQKEKEVHDVFARPHHDTVKEENAHQIQMQSDFTDLVGCSSGTARHLFEKVLRLDNFVPEGVPHRKKWDEDMAEDQFAMDSTSNLVTHQRVIERVRDQLQHMQYWKKNEFQRKCKYYRFGQYDYKLQRPFSEWNDPNTKDIIMMVDVMIPHNKMLSAEESSNCRVIQPQTTFIIRGDMLLSTLKQRIFCVSDMVVELEEGKEYEPPNMEESHAIKFPSGFIYINDTFYVDFTMEGQTDISAPIREFMARKKIFDPVSAVPMEGVRIIDLKLRIGQPYLYMHSGTCEHLLIFHDLSLLHRSDEQDISKYPMVAYEKFGDTKCSACKSDFATVQVLDNERLPQQSMVFCDQCFKDFHFFHGQKLGSFKAYPFFQMNRLGVFE